jgi:hypothetical protein
MSTAKKLKDIGKLYNATKKQEQRHYDPVKQAEGYRKRMEASGIDVEKAEDSRNLIERTLNLRENQNPIFDVFEIINRPQQALFGAIDAAQKGEDVFKGAVAGISGNKRMQFKEILHNEGMENTEGRLGVDDVLGFAGDVFLDPMDIGIAKISRVGKATKGLLKAQKSMDKFSDLSKFSEGSVELAKAVVKKEQTAARFSRAKSTLEKAKAMEKLGKGSYTVSGTQSVFGLIGSGIKGSFSLADTGIIELTTIMDRGFTEKFLKYMDKKYQGQTSLHLYEAMKEMANNTFKGMAKMPVDFLTKVRGIRGKEEVARKTAYTISESKLKEIDIIAQSIAEKGSFAVEDVKQALMNVYERGAGILDETGNITRKGMRQEFNVYELVRDEGFMLNTGVPKEVADALEEHMKLYMPDIYKKYHSEANPIFVKQPATEKTIETYRLRRPEIVNEARSYLDGLSDSEKTIKVRASILGDEGKVNFDALSESEKAKFVAIDEEIEYYEEARRANGGAQKVLRRGSEAERSARTAQRTVDSAYKKLEAINEKINKIPEFERDTDKVRKLFQKKDAAEAAHVAALDAHKKVWDTAGDDLLDLNTAIAGLKADRVRFDEVHGFQRLSADEVLQKSKDAKLTINSFFSDSYLAKMNEISKVEGFHEGLDAIHDTMSSIVKILKDKMGANFDHHDYYMAHALTDEWAKLNIDRVIESTASYKSFASTRSTIGNSKVFAKRRYQTSVTEANELAKGYAQYLVDQGIVSGDAADKVLSGKNIKMFADDINTSILDFATKAPKAVGDARMLSYVLSSTLLSGDPSIVRFKSQADIKTPFGFTEVTAASFETKIKQMKTYLGEGAEMDDLIKEVEKFLQAAGNKKMYINNNINRLIGRVTDPKETMPLLNFMDKLNLIFKKNKLLSPGFQMRNIAGNVSNMWLSGMPIDDIMVYNKKAAAIMKNGDNLFKRAALGEVLTGNEQKIYEQYMEFVENGFSNLGNQLHDIPEELWNTERVINGYRAESKHIERLEKKLRTIKNTPEGAIERGVILDQIKVAKLNKHKGVPKEAYDKLIGYNMKMNQKQDSIFRMSLYMYAKENPDYLLNNGIEDAASAVRRTLFDYQDLSVMEQDVMRKLIPFYTFMKKNLGYQMQNLMKNADRYNDLYKSFNSVWGVLDLAPDEVDKFKIENFWLPIPIKSSDGKYKALKISLPFGDLGEFLDNPIQRTLASTAPVLRAPFEMAMNKQVFSGMPISEFKGQKGFMIPEISRKAEFGLNQLGLDVPATAAADIGRTVKGIATGDITNPLQAAESAVGRTLVSQGDAAKTKSRQAYERLDALEDLMRYYKQEGIEIKTVAELENAGRFKSAKGLSEQLRALRGK